MSVESINSVSSINTGNYQAPPVAAKKENAEEVKASSENSGVVYEKSDSAKVDDSKKTYKPNTALVQQLKADQEAQKQNLINIVNKMMNDRWILTAEKKNPPAGL